MERAGSFTAVPGWGGVAMGCTALAAGSGSRRSLFSSGWHRAWMCEGVVAIAIGVFAMRQKARAAGLALWSAPARKFVFSFVPPLFAGAAADAGAVAAGLTSADSRNVAAALWNRSHDGRSVFGARWFP